MEKFFSRILSIFVSCGCLLSYSANIPDVNAADKTESTLILGDVNMNGEVDMSDLTDLSLWFLKNKEFTYEQTVAADTDENTWLNIADLAYLKQYICKVSNTEDTSNIGKPIKRINIVRPGNPKKVPAVTSAASVGTEQPITTTSRFWIDREPEPSEFPITAITIVSPDEQPAITVSPSETTVPSESQVTCSLTTIYE